MLNKLFVVCLFVLACSFNVSGKVPQNTFITVEASGVGANHDDALRDAFKDAVRKVVGVYAITQSKMLSSSQADELFDEKIYLNADAVVTDYKLLQKTENDGVITIKIKATVVKNDLQKYVKQQKTDQISDTEIANLINNVDVFDDVEKSLDYIFKDYGEQVFTVKKIGSLTQGPVIPKNKNVINILLNFEVSINREGYKKFSSRLQMLLDKVALSSKTGSGKLDKCHKSMIEFSKKQIHLESKCIALINHSETSVNYKIYAIHNKIYNKMTQYLNSPAILFQFYTKHKDEPDIRIITKTESERWDAQHVNFIYGIGFDDDILNIHNKFFTRYPYKNVKFTESFLFEIDTIKNLKECKIKYVFPLQKVRRGYSWFEWLSQIPSERLFEIFGKKFVYENLREEEKYYSTEFESVVIFGQYRIIHSF